MLNVPNQRTLPFYLIAVLVSTCGTLGYMVYNQGEQCESERQKDKIYYEKRIADCQDQARIDAREASQQLTAYLLKQDSINRASMQAIQKIRRK